jgi:hypothetical protein
MRVKYKSPERQKIRDSSEIEVLRRKRPGCAIDSEDKLVVFALVPEYFDALDARPRSSRRARGYASGTLRVRLTGTG